MQTCHFDRWVFWLSTINSCKYKPEVCRLVRTGNGEKQHYFCAGDEIALTCRRSQFSLCLSSRINEIRPVFSWLCGTAKYPAERGSEGRRFGGCHSANLCSSIRQKHFSLHSMSADNCAFLHSQVFCLSLFLAYTYCTFIYCVASFLRLRECLQESIRQRPPEVRQVRCSIVIVIIWPDASLIITFPFNHNLTCLVYPQQWNSKSLQWINGLHRESATRDISPYLPWSVYACCTFTHCRFVTVPPLSLDADFLRNGICRHNRRRTGAHRGCGSAKQTYSHSRRWEQEFMPALSCAQRVLTRICWNKQENKL